MKKAGHLVLADGTVFPGTIVGNGLAVGEVVFSTATTGYTEILSDPSFYGQIVVLANPEIGNYGVNTDDFQSDGIKIKALVVKNLSSRASSFRSHMTLADWLMRENVPVIKGVDTRALIAHIRDHGSMMAVVASSQESSLSEALRQAQEAPVMANKRLSHLVSVKAAKDVDDTLRTIEGTNIKPLESRFRVVALDFGIKKELIRYLHNAGCSVTLLPPDSRVEDIWPLEPDGVFLSNGPGDPSTEISAVHTVRAILGKVPIFGVCLGHQILAQALGMSTYKLKFGHRGSNQPVKNHDGSIWMTAQNHGFAVMPSSMEINADTNLSDGSNEGIDFPELSAFSVQFHPEGAPGPKDAKNCFEKFTNYMDEWKKKLRSSSCQKAKNDAPLSRIGPIAEDRDHRW